MLQQTEGESLKFGFVSMEEKAGSKRHGATLLMDTKKVEE